MQAPTALCHLLHLLPQGNPESQVAAKPALVPLLVLVQIPKVVEGPRDVDDLEQLAVAATDALSACVSGNAELQVGGWERRPGAGRAGGCGGGCGGSGR